MYIGPETVVPVATALAAIGGFAMLMWRRLVAFVRVQLLSRFRRRRS